MIRKYHIYFIITFFQRTPNLFYQKQRYFCIKLLCYLFGNKYFKSLNGILSPLCQKQPTKHDNKYTKSAFRTRFFKCQFLSAIFGTNKICLVL